MQQQKDIGGHCLKWLDASEKGLRKTLWPCAVQTAAHIRNRCYNNRTQTAPYFSMIGKKPDLSKMSVFYLECYTYQYDREKLDPKCVKGVFVGYDKNSPAYLVYPPEAGKIMNTQISKIYYRLHFKTRHANRNCQWWLLVRLKMISPQTTFGNRMKQVLKLKK